MPLILSGNVASATAGGYEVANSCIFDDGGSAYMYKTPGSVGDLQKWTYSVWFKRGNLGSEQYLLEYNEAADHDDNFRVTIASGDTIYIQDTEANTSNLDLRTNQVFRDCSAWYNLIIAVDTTQAVAANRCKVYLNGTQITSWATETYPDQNYNTNVNVANENIVIGRRESIASPTSYFDGYMAEVVFIDGTQYANTDFGEFDEDSPTIWKPKDVSGLTFGTNGFYLDFEASGNLGNDANGGTDLTESGLAATDQMTDTPTNNFCTCNPLLNTGGGITFAEGNCKIKSASDNQWTIGTQHSQQGYFEVKVGTAPNASNGTGLRIGIVSLDDHVDPDGTGATFSSSSDTYHFDNPTAQGFRKFDSGTTTDIGGTRAINDILSVAWSSVAPNGIWFAVNGVWFNDQEDGPDSTTLDTSNPDFSINTGKFYLPIFFSSLTGLDEADINFGNPSNTISSSNTDADGYGNFEYAVPSGFFALNTKNLAEYG